MPTYNYVNQSKKTGPCGHVYVNVNLFWFFLPPPPCQPKPPLSHLSCQRVFKFPSSIPKKKERKKGKKKMYRIVSCRVANARVGYRIKCLSKV